MKQSKEYGVTTIQHEVSETMGQFLRVQSEHIEMFAAAFWKRIGTDGLGHEVEDYILVERRNGHKTTWSFELKSEHPEFARTPESYL